jgi:hypothetical protein
MKDQRWALVTLCCSCWSGLPGATSISGHTLRLFETQSDGSWKTTVHTFDILGAP